MVTNIYYNPVAKGFNLFNGTISIIMVVLGAVILVAAIVRWIKLWRGESTPMPDELVSQN
jgi:carbon starvation protein